MELKTWLKTFMGIEYGEVDELYLFWMKAYVFEKNTPFRTKEIFNQYTCNYAWDEHLTDKRYVIT
jgi:hypothetical protein